MKSQRGFVIFAGLAAWLVAAGASGTFIVVAEQLSEDKATVATQSQDQSPLMLTAATDITPAPATPAVSTRPQTFE
jgi:hypothetical protein